MSEESLCSRGASSVYTEIELQASGKVPFPGQRTNLSSALFHSIAIPTHRLADGFDETRVGICRFHLQVWKER
jgi:hypothetical protein